MLSTCLSFCMLFTCVVPFNHHKRPMKYMLLFPFHRWKHRSSKTKELDQVRKADKLPRWSANSGISHPRYWSSLWINDVARFPMPAFHRQLPGLVLQFKLCVRVVLTLSVLLWGFSSKVLCNSYSVSGHPITFLSFWLHKVLQGLSSFSRWRQTSSSGRELSSLAPTERRLHISP